MAKLTVVEEKPLPPPKKYVLELTEDEVMDLVFLIGRGTTYGDLGKAKGLKSLWEGLSATLRCERRPWKFARTVLLEEDCSCPH